MIVLDVSFYEKYGGRAPFIAFVNSQRMEPQFNLVKKNFTTASCHYEWFGGFCCLVFRVLGLLAQTDGNIVRFVPLQRVGIQAQ